MRLSRGCRNSCRHVLVSTSWPHRWLAHKQFECGCIAGAELYHCATQYQALIPLQCASLHADIHWQCEDRVLGHGFGTVEAFCHDAVRFFHIWLCLIGQLISNVM